MSATRLLILGLVRAHGRAHGYLIQRLLTTWHADEWANVKWGSIYHALKQMTKEGKLRAHEVPKSPGRVDYEPTEAGHDEYFRLLKDALRNPERGTDMLAAGVAFMVELPRDEVLTLLRERLEKLESTLKMYQTCPPEEAAEFESDAAPPHLVELPRLWIHKAEQSAAWTRGLIKRLRAGAYEMADACDDAPGPSSPTE